MLVCRRCSRRQLDDHEFCDCGAYLPFDGERIEAGSRPPMPSIILLFREVDREQVGQIAGRLRSRLDAEGLDLSESSTVASSDIVLVAVGRGWLGTVASDASSVGGTDVALRAEIARASMLGKVVIPVALPGAALPSIHEVSEELEPHTWRPGVRLRADELEQDVQSLVERLRHPDRSHTDAPGWQMTPEGGPPSSRMRRDEPALIRPSLPAAPIGDVEACVPAAPVHESVAPVHESVASVSVAPTARAGDGPCPRCGTPHDPERHFCRHCGDVITAGDGATRSDRDVQVTVHRPRAMKRGELTRMPVFVHRTHDAAAVEELSRALLGPAADDYERIRQDGRTDVRRGWEIVIDGWIEGGTCNPERVAYRWNGTLQHAVLLIRYHGTDDVARGGVRVFANGVILAESTFAVLVDAATSNGAADPLIEARPTTHRRVFASYSHKDKSVVRYMASALRTLGQDLIIDSEVLRSGDGWADRLDGLIRTADAFQLFWSKHSMRSAHVQHEWELALSLHRANFVFPVYWQDPRPTDPPLLPPAELDKIHFSKLELPGRIASTLTRVFR